MALYKDYRINGKCVTLNTDGITLAIEGDDALWMWSDEGSYVKVEIGSDGAPVTSVSMKNDDGSRSNVVANWQDMVSGTDIKAAVDNADNWIRLADIVIEQIKKQVTNPPQPD